MTLSRTKHSTEIKVKLETMRLSKHGLLQLVEKELPVLPEKAANSASDTQLSQEQHKAAKQMDARSYDREQKIAATSEEELSCRLA